MADLEEEKTAPKERSRGFRASPAESPFERREEDGVFVVTGGDVERILNTTDPDDEVSMRRFQQLLIRFGIIAALREMGAGDGDTVELGGWQFDFMD